MEENITVSVHAWNVTRDGGIGVSVPITVSITASEIQELAVSKAKKQLPDDPSLRFAVSAIQFTKVFSLGSDFTLLPEKS